LQSHIINKDVSSYSGGDHSFGEMVSESLSGVVAYFVLRRSMLYHRRGVGASLRK
jgi:hypothetical protein